VSITCPCTYTSWRSTTASNSTVSFPGAAFAGALTAINKLLVSARSTRRGGTRKVPCRLGVISSFTSRVRVVLPLITRVLAVVERFRISKSLSSGRKSMLLMFSSASEAILRVSTSPNATRSRSTPAVTLAVTLLLSNARHNAKPIATRLPVRLILRFCSLLLPQAAFVAEFLSEQSRWIVRHAP